MIPCRSQLSRYFLPTVSLSLALQWYGQQLQVLVTALTVSHHGRGTWQTFSFSPPSHHAVSREGRSSVDIHSCELILVSVTCDPHYSLWLWKTPTKCNRPLQLRARWKTTGKAVCCTIHSCTWAYGRRRMRGGSRRRELCRIAFLTMLSTVKVCFYNLVK